MSARHSFSQLFLQRRQIVKQLLVSIAVAWLIDCSFLRRALNLFSLLDIHIRTYKKNLFWKTEHAVKAKSLKVIARTKKNANKL